MPKSAESPASTAGEVHARGAESTTAPGPESRIRQPTRSIGQVMAILRTEFPEISISKIRFLEAEGLISPLRAPSGYRRYTESDLERLRYVLSVQREHYLPLKVIRDHLEQIDRGQTPPTHASQTQTPQTQTPQTQIPQTQIPQTLSGQSGAPSNGLSGAGPHVVHGPHPTAATAKQPVRLTRQELLDASGLTESALSELERTQIVATRRGTAHYGRDALTLAIAARRLAEYGIDGRHLRAFKLAAEREVGLVEQAIAPYVRRAGSNRDVPGDVTQLVISFHAALVRTAMERSVYG
jgi:DNA-binding transcriptional MerR regulator